MPTLRLLGGATIEDDAGPLSGAATQRHRLALLALLARAHPGGLGRDKVVAYLWPERDTEHARNLLRQAVHALRRTLGEQAILSVGDELRLDADVVRVDLLEFEEALEAEALERALELHGGPFLDGFFLPEAVAFERWVDRERSRVRDSYRGALEALARAAVERGDPVSAVGWWRRLAADDPCSSRASLELMRALEAAGERAEAIRQGRIHALLLEQELGAQPDPAIVELMQRLRLEPEAELKVDRRTVANADEAGAPEGERLVRAAPAAPGRWGRRLSRRSIRAAALIAGAVALAFSGTYVWSRGGPIAPAGVALEDERFVLRAPMDAETPSIAVLAFDDLSPEGDQAWFADGIAEEILHALSRVQGLRVSARHSSFAFRDRQLDVRRIAHSLGVGLVLEGSVRKGGDSVWVAAQLIDGATGFHRWSETYAAILTAESLRAIQNAVARDVATSLALRFRAEPDVGSGLPNGRAYETYLEGRYHLRGFQSGATRNPREVLRSIDHFRQVVDSEPDWAPGSAALGEALHWAAYVGFEPAKHHEESKRALERALALDPSHAQANASLGYVLHRWDRDHDAADARFRQALELDSEAYWHCGYSLFLLGAGRYEEAVEATRRAEAHDPLYLPLKGVLSASYLCAGRFDDAIRQSEDLLSIAPGAAGALRDLALALEGSGRAEEALLRLDEAEEPRAYVDLVRALLLARAGRTAQADALLLQVDVEQATAWAARVYSSKLVSAPAIQAAALVAVGRPEAAIEVLEVAMDRDPETLLYDRCYRELEALEGSPRYQELLRRTGVPGW